MKSGEIVGFFGSWGSGIAQLVLEEGNHTFNVFCENGPTVRLLGDLFPGFITRGHTVDPSAICGETVYYEVDDLGMLVALSLDP